MKFFLLGGLAILAVAVPLGLAVTSPSNVPAIQACYKDGKGDLRLNVSGGCLPNESPIELVGPANLHEPTRAFSRLQGPAVDVPDDFGSINQLDLPPGSFVISGKAEFRNPSSEARALVSCFAPGDATKFWIGAETPTTANLVVVPFEGTYSSDVPSTIHLICRDDIVGAPHDVVANHSRLTAIQVEELIDGTPKTPK